MKKIFTILGFILSVSAFAQNGDAVVNALKEGNASKFSSYFDNNVDLKLPKQNEMQNINKADAAGVLKNFFTTNNINGFEVISQREMSGTMYIAGKLKSGSQDYNITVMLKKKGDNTSIITVRIN
jgi:Domain of unknown function (DUF4783)